MPKILTTLLTAVTSSGIDFLVNLFVNNGTAIAVIAYFMWRDFKFMDTLNSALQKLIETTDTLKALIIEKERED